MRKFAVVKDRVAGVGTFPQPSAGLQRVLASVHLMGIEPRSSPTTNTQNPNPYPVGIFFALSPLKRVVASRA